MRNRQSGQTERSATLSADASTKTTVPGGSVVAKGATPRPAATDANIQSPQDSCSAPSTPSPTGDADGKRPSKIARALLGVVLLGATACSGYWAFWRANLKRFAIVEEGVLIRSGQPTEFGLKHLIRYHGVKTILSLRQEDDIIHIGALDGGEPSGRRESAVVAELDARFLHWPMGGEAYWPWLPPKQFEEFFELFDNQENLPVAVHCVAGRHRTGTLAALYRLEYDRWPVERTLEEVHSFDFGEPIPVQLVNLRTYSPRPLPDQAAMRQLAAACSEFVQDGNGYEDIIRQLNACADKQRLGEFLVSHAESNGAFAMPIARRLIATLAEESRQELAAISGNTIRAQARVADENALTGVAAITHPTTADIHCAAAIIADYGTQEDQLLLLGILRSAANSNTHADDSFVDDETHDAIVAGVGDRYTPNRMPYLRALLEDTRPLPSASADGFRYCDLAVARLTAIVNERFVDELPPVESMWDRAVDNARNWLEDNQDALQLTQRVPPIEHRMAMDALRLDQDGGDRFR